MDFKTQFATECPVLSYTVDFKEMDPSFGVEGVHGPDRFGLCAIKIKNTEMKKLKEISFKI
jgi:hypothetical protein